MEVAILHDDKLMMMSQASLLITGEMKGMATLIPPFSCE